MFARLAVAGLLLAGVLAAPSPTGAEECPGGNLFRGVLPTTEGVVNGAATAVSSGRFVSEGADWQSHGLWWSDRSAVVVLELPEPLTVRGFVIQADNNDQYAIEVEDWGGGWSEAWLAPAVESSGLRTRLGWLGAPITGQRFRVRAATGDGAFALGSIRAYCQRPRRWSDFAERADSRAPTQSDERGVVFTADHADSLKGALALVGLLMLLWSIAVARAGNPTADRRARAGGLVLAAALAAVAWWNFFHFHFPTYVHVWEHYHYTIGAKYFDEVGFTHMYACAVVADAERGVDLAGREYRDLVSNEMRPAETALQFSEECHRRFGDERWEEYQRDLDPIRRRMGRERWAEAQHDHGYNATPVWRLLGGPLSSIGDTSDHWLGARALLDPVLLAVMWGFVFWAFGWRAACVALIWWGTNWPARYFWVGGGLLRQDWLAALVIGVCLARKGKMFASGSLITYAALLRIFPGFVVLPLVLKVLWQSWKRRQLALTRPQWTFAAGCVAALAVLVPASILHSGPSSWGAFIDNSRKHVDTPLTNNMGVKTVVTFEAKTRARKSFDDERPDPFSQWKQARRNAWSARWPLYAVGLIAFLALVARGARARGDWVALCLGAAVIPFAAELTCYYYSFLLLLAFVGDEHDLRPGATLLGLSVATVAIAKIGLWYDELFTLTSLAVVLALVPIAHWAARPKAVGGPEENAVAGGSTE